MSSEWNVFLNEMFSRKSSLYFIDHYLFKKDFQELFTYCSVKKEGGLSSLLDAQINAFEITKNNPILIFEMPSNKKQQTLLQLIYQQDNVHIGKGKFKENNYEYYNSLDALFVNYGVPTLNLTNINIPMFLSTDYLGEFGWVSSFIKNPNFNSHNYTVVYQINGLSGLNMIVSHYVKDTKTKTTTFNWNPFFPFLYQK